MVRDQYGTLDSNNCYFLGLAFKLYEAQQRSDIFLNAKKTINILNLLCHISILLYSLWLND